ncbi:MULTISPECIES: zinc ABC transporter substrate-binding protein AztC [Mycobacteriaceae]|uniref:ABC transporter substrate-binding protein n=1 Tax=Mycolicibacterium neoaurum VKM Ac-1815D TaxID=700508 RepID=V5XHV7_MYCNE|nr:MULTISPECIES: zinc ABC transporter substrate-binding protein AztC [Mycobacteriaceae]AHC27562.1 ABC transporter substrate-binding protein [Mycolicibacterium neoaurum VKM Ac-1815D]AMO07758.1 ABC transporter substrate-binding protein [Mycolicibacterium neoaurum]AXK73838.1 zinc ABC transporter substrate-binding protein [Mycolicibacterium neoaurum]KJQ49592.1 ABC transporter substrate-binding protein [Mycolicibacterium neoaurum]KUM06235.1 ABC transporter substrate-binding protein [Mycolicibacteri
MRRLLTLLLTLVGVLIAGCGGQSTGRGAIVVTTNILGDVVRNIVGDTAPVRVLMHAGADPHSFGISAQDAAAMNDAALIVHNGLGLEENLVRNVETAAAQGASTIAVGEHIDPIRYTDGESAGTPDPHFWTDPQRMVTAVDVIEQALLRDVAGIDREALSRNADAYREQLRALDRYMLDAFATLQADRRKLVTNHHVLGYLAQRFGFQVIGAVVPSGTTLAAPSPSDLQSLVGAIEDARVPAIFVDSSQPDKLARVLAEDAGVRVRIIGLYSESLSAPGTPGATYLDMMRANTDAIVTGLR